MLLTTAYLEKGRNVSNSANVVTSDHELIEHYHKIIRLEATILSTAKDQRSMIKFVFLENNNNGIIEQKLLKTLI